MDGRMDGWMDGRTDGRGPQNKLRHVCRAIKYMSGKSRRRYRLVRAVVRREWRTVGWVERRGRDGMGTGRDPRN